MNAQSMASPASRDRAGALRAEPFGLGQSRSSTDAFDPRVIRLRHAQQDVRARFDAKYLRLMSDMQAELDGLERQFWKGEI